MSDTNEIKVTIVQHCTQLPEGLISKGWGHAAKGAGGRAATAPTESNTERALPRRGRPNV